MWVENFERVEHDQASTIELLANSYRNRLQLFLKDFGALDKGSLRVYTAAIFDQLLVLLVQINHIKKDVFAAHERHVFRLRETDSIKHTSVSVQFRRYLLKLPLIPVWLGCINEGETNPDRIETDLADFLDFLLENLARVHLDIWVGHVYHLDGLLGQNDQHEHVDADGEDRTKQRVVGRPALKLRVKGWPRWSRSNKNFAKLDIS